MSCGKMKKRNLKRRLRVQRLEDRRLLAADLSFVELMPVENVEPAMCQIVEAEVPSEVLEFDVAELPEDSVDAVDSVDDAPELQPEADVDAGVESETGPESKSGPESEVELETDTQQQLHDLGDPVDGTDGFFGAIDSETPLQSFKITPSESGVVDIVVASSWGDAGSCLEVTDSNGDVVASTATEEVPGFQMLSFESQAGQRYQLDVSSEQGAEGNFQVTVGHSDIPEPVDLHVDTVSDQSTELEFVDGTVGLNGELELQGDVDTFRFTANSSGNVSLNLAELNTENATELQVQVLSTDGAALTRGITNETVGISFEVESSQEYFLAISAGEGQTGSYQIDMTFEADATEPEVEPVVDQHVNEIGEGATELVLVDGVVSIAGDLETADDADAFQFSAPGDGYGALDLKATSEDNSADASVAVFDASSDPVATGATNDDVGIVFDVAQGDSYYVLVDSLNDVPASYQLTVSFTAADFDAEVDLVDELESADELPELDLVEESPEVADAGEIAEVDLVEDEMDLCFTDLEGESDVVDSIFADFDLDGVFTIEGEFEIGRV